MKCLAKEIVSLICSFLDQHDFSNMRQLAKEFRKCTGLQKLILRNSYNQPLAKGVLPDSLTHLTFGYCFNQLILPGVLPASVKHLRVKHKFNGYIGSCVLPAGLIHLRFGWDWES